MKTKLYGIGWVIGLCLTCNESGEWWVNISGLTIFAASTYLVYRGDKNAQY